MLYPTYTIPGSMLSTYDRAVLGYRQAEGGYPDPVWEIILATIRDLAGEDGWVYTRSVSAASQRRIKATLGRPIMRTTITKHLYAAQRYKIIQTRGSTIYRFRESTEEERASTPTPHEYGRINSADMT